MGNILFILIMKLIKIFIALIYIILSIIFTVSNDYDTIGYYLLGVIGGSQLVFLLENLLAIIITKSIK